MTYQELRALFAQVARHDGRLTVLHATDDPLAFPLASMKSGEGEGRSWSVAVRDHLHRTYVRVDRLAAFTQYEQTGFDPASPMIVPLMAVHETEPPTFEMAWPDVLHVLDEAARVYPKLSVSLIEATLDRSPRYGVGVKMRGRAGSLLLSRYASFELLREQAGHSYSEPA